MNVGDTVVSGNNVEVKVGNAMPLESMPVGIVIHNVEMQPGKGGAIGRSAGNEVRLMAKENGRAILRLPSGEMRTVVLACRATVGQVGNLDHEIVNIGKAGRMRHMGVRPHVRGAVMNPVDHPHGGGEGKNSIGHVAPMTPWGKKAVGKTRNKKKNSSKFIIKRVN